MRKVPLIITCTDGKYDIPGILARVGEILDQIRPIIVVSDSADGATELARTEIHEIPGLKSAQVGLSKQISVEVLEVPGSKSDGTLPAIRAALRYLGNDDAVRPWLTFNGSEYPVNPKKWFKIMMKPLLTAGRPMVVSGPVKRVARNDQEKRKASYVTCLTWLTGLLSQLVPFSRSMGKGFYYGPNQGYYLATWCNLKAILDLPTIWPDEDVAMTQVVASRSGLGLQKVIVNPSAMIYFPLADTTIDIKDMFKGFMMGGAQGVREVAFSKYHWEMTSEKLHELIERRFK